MRQSLNPIAFLESWYHAQCDGDWEHMYGVKVTTLDNPGWWIEIDLVETDMDGKEFDSFYVFNDDDDWIRCYVKNRKFDGSGDPNKFERILKIFQDWILANEK